MRITNRRISGGVNLIYTLLFLGLFFSLLLVLIPISSIVKVISPYWLLLIFVLSIIIVKKTGHQQFEYSSDGETITIKTKDPFWSKYFQSNQRLIDFPKRKLANYKVKRGIFCRKLELYLISKRSHNNLTKLTFNISFLSRGEISDLKRSLNKIYKKNSQKNEALNNKEDQSLNNTVDE